MAAQRRMPARNTDAPRVLVRTLLIGRVGAELGVVARLPIARVSNTDFDPSTTTGYESIVWNVVTEHCVCAPAFARRV